jgi:hypothetical protein
MTVLAWANSNLNYRPSPELTHVQKDFSLFKSERLNRDIKLTLYNALIRSEMEYVCFTCEYAADGSLLKRQRLQDRVLRPTGNLDR